MSVFSMLAPEIDFDGNFLLTFFIWESVGIGVVYKGLLGVFAIYKDERLWMLAAIWIKGEGDGAFLADIHKLGLLAARLKGKLWRTVGGAIGHCNRPALHIDLVWLIGVQGKGFIALATV